MKSVHVCLVGWGAGISRRGMEDRSYPETRIESRVNPALIRATRAQRAHGDLGQPGGIIYFLAKPLVTRLIANGEQTARAGQEKKFSRIIHHHTAASQAMAAVSDGAVRLLVRTIRL